ncbi:MAG TPA: SDR family oxidoreductase [Candidatus Angelobacter sp.]|nr:SDR family oxidoreductase [Candidatus Angelobacter sp.]
MTQTNGTSHNGSSSSNGKVALVTGGTRGIGLAISIALAGAGYRVYAVYARNRAAAQLLADHAKKSGLDIRCLRANLADEDGCALCVHTIKAETTHVDVIVHSAASGVHREVTKLTPKHIRWTFDINVVSIHTLLLELVPMMPAGGRIIGLTSFGATHVNSLTYGAVGSSKAALESLFRHYARELAPRGIAVNLVSPGLVATTALDAFPDKEYQLETGLALTPTGRLTTPEDVAGVVLFACSEAAAQVVGQTIYVDGGRSLR